MGLRSQGLPPVVVEGVGSAIEADWILETGVYEWVNPSNDGREKKVNGPGPRTASNDRLLAHKAEVGISNISLRCYDREHRPK